MPLKDGLNAEGEMPDPEHSLPKEWRVKDLQRKKGKFPVEVVLHDMKASPPCCKVRTLLTLFKIPYTSVYKRAPGAYSKRPVLIITEKGSGPVDKDTGERTDMTWQINDSHIILRCLHPIIYGEPMKRKHVDLDQMVSDGLIPAFEARAFNSGLDLQKFALIEGYGSWWTLDPVWMPLVRGGLSYTYSWSLQWKHHWKVKAAEEAGEPPPFPLYHDTAALLKQLADALKTGGLVTPFFAGSTPGVIDCAVYGALAPFIESGMQFATYGMRVADALAQDKHIGGLRLTDQLGIKNTSSLQQWYANMETVIPPGALFPWYEGRRPKWAWGEEADYQEGWLNGARGFLIGT